jgi:uroporphyrinogen-III decarboxylase
MTEKLDSRQRLLHAIHFQEVDRPPCCFMSFAVLRKRVNDDWFALARAEHDLGIDPMLFIPSLPRSQRPDHPDLRGLPVRFHPQVKVREWKENGLMGTDFLRKEYLTPAGVLSTHIRISDDWPHGDHIPFVDDFQVPRMQKPLIGKAKNLESLRFLLQPPHPEDIAAYQKENARAQVFIKEVPVLLAGGWGVGMDMANWLCGMQDLMTLMLEQPEFVDELLEMIHQWNRQRMEVILASPIDLYIRRAWYEGCDFVTPRFFQRSILPRLKAEVSLAHAHGVKFGYICSSGTKPMLDYYLDAGIDVLIGIDPIQGTHTDMQLMKTKLGQRVCLWGGVSAAVTVEQGSEAEIRSAVQHAIQTLGPQGMVLSPIDNITIDSPRTWENIQVFIDEWRKNG